MTTDDSSIEPTIQVQASAAFQKNLRILNTDEIRAIISTSEPEN